MNDFDALRAKLPIPIFMAGNPGSSVFVQLGPYMESDAAMSASSDVPILVCPSDSSFQTGTQGTSYSINISFWDSGSASAFATLAQIPCGTSNAVFGGDYTQQGLIKYNSSSCEQNFCFGNGLYGSKATAPPKVSKGGDGYGLDFNSFHVSPSVNLGLFDGHVVSATSKTAAQAGINPNVGNTSGNW